MPPTSPTPPPEPLVSIDYPDPHHIDLTLHPGADAETINMAIGALPPDAVFLDHRGGPGRTVLTFGRIPDQPQPQSSLPVTPPGWTPTTNGHRAPADRPTQAVRAVTAGLLLGDYDHQIVHPSTDRTQPTVLTIVRLVRTRADLLARPAPHDAPRPPRTP